MLTAATSQFDAMAMAQLAHQNQILALQGFAVQQAPPQQQQGELPLIILHPLPLLLTQFGLLNSYYFYP